MICTKEIINKRIIFFNFCFVFPAFWKRTNSGHVTMLNSYVSQHQHVTDSDIIEAMLFYRYRKFTCGTQSQTIVCTMYKCHYIVQAPVSGR